MVQVKDIMQKNVVTIGKEKPVLDAANTMIIKNISCLLIVEGDKIAGILTLKDIVQKVMIKKLSPDTVTVNDIMTKAVQTIDQENKIMGVAGVMKLSKIKQIPVVSEGKLVGIITQTDLVRNLNSIAGI